MSYLLPHLTSGWAVDQAILSEEARLVCLRFGHDYDPVCMQMDEVLYSIAELVKNYCVIYLVDTTEVPDFNTMYELYDPCTVMFFYRNKVRARPNRPRARVALLPHSRAPPRAAHHDRPGHGQQQQDQLGDPRQTGGD
jgi:DIM1 family U5 snRNP protein